VCVCLCVCVCVYYICKYIYIYIYIYTHTHICLYVCMYVCMYVCIYICTKIHIAVCVQYVALSGCLSAKQMAKRKQCKVPKKQGQRIALKTRPEDHTTKLEASLPRHCRCHWHRDRGEPALRTAPALLQASLPRWSDLIVTEVEVSER
jgi:hypothetical protein